MGKKGFAFKKKKITGKFLGTLPEVPKQFLVRVFSFSNCNGKNGIDLNFFFFFFNKTNLVVKFIGISSKFLP